MGVDDAGKREERILKTRVLFEMLRSTYKIEDVDLMPAASFALSIFEEMRIEDAADFTAENFKAIFQSPEGWRDDWARMQGYKSADDPRRKADTARFFDEFSRESWDQQDPQD